MVLPKFFFFFKIYLFRRKRGEHVCASEEGQKRRDKESQAESALGAQSGSIPQPWDHDLSGKQESRRFTDWATSKVISVRLFMVNNLLLEKKENYQTSTQLFYFYLKYCHWKKVNWKMTYYKKPTKYYGMSRNQDSKIPTFANKRYITLTILKHLYVCNSAALSTFTMLCVTTTTVHFWNFIPNSTSIK